MERFRHESKHTGKFVDLTLFVTRYDSSVVNMLRTIICSSRDNVLLKLKKENCRLYSLKLCIDWCHFQPLLAVVGQFLYWLPTLLSLYINYTGNMELCYLNYGCSRPYKSVDDFNHLISNIGYFIYGGVFIAMVLIKSKVGSQNQALLFDL